MEHVTYYYAQNKQAEHLNKIVADPLFKEIVTYFTERQNQDIILRQLKSDIPTTSNLELFLDKLINYKLLERKNRRYSLSFPIYSTEVSPFLPESVTNLIEVMRTEDVRSRCFVFGEWFWSLFFEEEQGSYFFGVKETSKKSPLFQRREQGNDTLRFVSIFTNHQIPLDFANYFSLLSKRKQLPKHFESLQNLIGDVNLDYFILQIRKVMRSVNRSTVRERKTTIFQEALLITGDLTRNEEQKLELVVPLLEDVTLSANTQEYLEQVKLDLVVLWKKTVNENERVFFKQQLYSTIVHNCSFEHDYLQYYII